MIHFFISFRLYILSNTKNNTASCNKQYNTCMFMVIREFIDQLDKIQKGNNSNSNVPSSDKINVKFFVSLLAHRNGGMKRNEITKS